MFDDLCRWHSCLVFALNIFYFMFCASPLRLETRKVDWHVAEFLANRNFLLIDLQEKLKSIHSLLPPSLPTSAWDFFNYFPSKATYYFTTCFLSLNHSKHTLPATQPAPTKNKNLCIHHNFKNFFHGFHKTTCTCSIVLSYSWSTFS